MLARALDLAERLPEGGTRERLQRSAAQAVRLSPDEEPLDLQELGLTQRDALLQVCDRVTVWRSPDGEAYASVPVGGHVEHHAIASRGFRHWLRYELAIRFRQSGRPASASNSAVRDARASVEARALLEGAIHPAVLRVAEHTGEICVDLGWPDWRVVRVTGDGWSVASSPVPILRTRRTGPFAVPSKKDFAPLRRLLGHLDGGVFVLFLGWCLGALLPHGPYGILILGGEQGSGKSTLARLAQRLTDPCTGTCCSHPAPTAT